MAMVINTNMGSINAQRILDGTSVSQATAMERLTSGLRINKSADDSAGLAVATGMTTQIRGTDQAIRNANDGMGLIKTMDGASEEVINMLQRMRELGLQSMNGTYSEANRSQMNAEVQQLKSEIERVADTTKFNGMNIMTSGHFQTLTVGSVQAAAQGNFDVTKAGNSSLKLHVGWETESANRIGIMTLDFKGLSSLGGDIKLGGAKFTSGLKLASAMISKIDSDLSAIKTMRSYWGAVQNRLEYTVSNLSNVNENIQGSRSGILDADYAKESAALAKSQVLQQAGMSMLSQANMNAQNALSLLR